MRIAPVTIAVMIALFAGTTACSSDSQPESKPTPVEEVTVDPAEDTGEYVDPSEGLEGLTFEMTWAETPEANKDLMCTSMSVLGKEWAKEQLQAGGAENGDGDLYSMDWDKMVDLMSDRCEAEGR